MDARENLLAKLSRRRLRVGLSIAACLAAWLGLYALAERAAPSEGLAHEILTFVGDLLGLAAASLALTTPWTPAQRAREADKRLRRDSAKQV